MIRRYKKVFPIPTLDLMMQDTILDFLRQLAVAQNRAVDILQRKQALLVKPDKANLDKMVAEENEVLALLRQAYERREEILTQTQAQGQSYESIQELCDHVLPDHTECRTLLQNSREQGRRIRYLALTNWTMTQKSIIHLAQMLEIIETRGQGKTTYSSQNHKEGPATSGGGFVDRVA